jgi:general stress protein 26
MRAGQYRKNPKASIYFFHKGLVEYIGVMLVGTMKVLEDQKTKKEIWRPGDAAYYPKGATDPDYAVLKFTAKHGKYYRNLTHGTFKI